MAPWSKFWTPRIFTLFRLRMRHFALKMSDSRISESSNIIPETFCRAEPHIDSTFISKSRYKWHPDLKFGHFEYSNFSDFECDLLPAKWTTRAMGECSNVSPNIFCRQNRISKVLLFQNPAINDTLIQNLDTLNFRTFQTSNAAFHPQNGRLARWVNFQITFRRHFERKTGY
jgi:hypothetical protein